MTPTRFVPIVIAAVLPFAGCGGCNQAETPPRPTPTTAARTAAMASTTTTLPAVAHDGKYTLYRPSAWHAGDTVTSESATTTNGRFTRVTADGQSPQVAKARQTVHASWVEQATDVDAEGHRTRYLVYLHAWSRTSEKARDRSVKGAILTVSGTGAGRTWALTNPRFQPTDEARNWLDDHFGSRGVGDEQWLRLMLPDGNVAPGASWSADPALLAEYFGGLGMPVERSAVKATITLVSIDGGLARCAIKGSVLLPHVPNTDVPWTKGGRLAFEGDMSVMLEPAPLFLSSRHGTVTLQGEATQDGATVGYDLTTDERRTTTPGGEFPSGQ
jgi:hypothetical protein